MFHIRYTAIAAVVVLGLTGCVTTERPAKAKQGSAASADPSIVIDEATPTSTPEPDPPELARLGDTMVVYEWEVKVTQVARNANAVIHQVDRYNPKPKGQYVLVTYEATYTGSARTADVRVDLRWTLTTRDNQIHEQAYRALTLADTDQWPNEARRGGTVKGQVVFDVKPQLIKGSILSVETYDKDFEKIYADFGI